MKPTNETMYRALLEKDATYEGVFYAAVKTTGIFCRPTCTARKPKKENVEFYSTPKEAIQHGYRPCKVCSPMEKPEETPEYIADLLKELSADPVARLHDHDLVERGLEPSAVRRWFKKQLGMTFQSYQRMLRINTAFQKLRGGESVTAAAFDMGYESLSGFNDSFKAILGVSPSESKTTTVIHFTRLETPLGPMLAAATSEGICLLEFTDRRMLETELKTLTKVFNAAFIPGENPHLDLLEHQLREYFDGRRTEFSIPLIVPATPFQQDVWNELQRIPFGTTRSYSEQATALKKREAIRAVAHANGMNRISILIPCHRVVGADGQLTGYGGGLWRKQWLLDFEKNVLHQRKTQH